MITHIVEKNINVLSVGNVSCKLYNWNNTQEWSKVMRNLILLFMRRDSQPLVGTHYRDFILHYIVYIFNIIKLSKILNYLRLLRIHIHVMQVIVLHSILKSTNSLTNVQSVTKVMAHQKLWKYIYWNTLDKGHINVQFVTKVLQTNVFRKNMCVARYTNATYANAQNVTNP